MVVRCCPSKTARAIAALICSLEIGLVLACPLGQPSDTAHREALVALNINSERVDDFASVVMAGCQLYMHAALLDRARLQLPATASVLDWKGERYVRLSVIDEVQVEFNEATQTLDLHVPPAAFVPRRYQLGAASLPRLTPAAVGGFVNYDLAYAHSLHSRQISGLTELGAFASGGTLTSRIIGLDLLGDRAVARLDTSFTRDDPQRMTTFVAGDSVSGAAALGRPAYFGGLQWRTNYATRPQYQPVALPALSGVAATASVVEMYAQGVLAHRQSVDAGPFSIANVPNVGAGGTVQMVVRDVLGRQQVVTQSYLVSSHLLRAGASDHSLQAGWLRRSFGTASARYAEPFASASLRHGFARATASSHLEVSPISTAASGALSMRTSDSTLGTVAAGASHSTRGAGLTAAAQFEHVGTRSNMSVRAQFYGDRFAQVGLDERDLAPVRTLQAQAGASVGAGWSLYASVLDHVARGRGSGRVATLGTSWNADGWGTLSINIVHSSGAASSIFAGLVWVIPVGTGSVVQASAASQQGRMHLTADFQRAPGATDNLSTRLRLTHDGGRGGADAGLTYFGSAGQFSFAAARAGEHSSVLAQVRGGVGVAGGHARATRWIDDSFAIVEGPPGAPADIVANNVRAGSTDESGVGIVPRLVAYVPNSVRLDDRDIPLDWEVDLAERQVVPPHRAGLILRFGVVRQTSVLLVLTDELGRFLPVGARVLVGDAQPVAQVALRGETYIKDLALPTRLEVEHAGARCQVQVPAQAAGAILPRIGPLSCRPMRHASAADKQE